LILTSCSNVSARVNWVKANEWRKSPVLLSATRIRTSARFFDILPAIKKGEDSYEAWFGLNQSTFGGFLFHRWALLRRISAGFTSSLPGPRSCDKRTLHQNLRLISPFSRTEPYGASAKRNAKAAKERALTFAFYSPIVGAVEETGDGPASCRTGGGVSPSAFKGQRVKRQPAPLPSLGSHEPVAVR